MCIEAFFNDDDTAKSAGEKQRRRRANNKNAKITMPWKAAQLGYLRTLQIADLKARNRRDDNTNMMFVARRVVPLEDVADEATKRAIANEQPLLLDLDGVYNLPPNADVRNQDYAKGEVMGFVEVTKREYALPYELDEQSRSNNNNQHFMLATNPFQSMQPTKDRKRPILTNLSVCAEARKSGVGSKLVEWCERTVMKEWSTYEIVLEVEDDNENAKRFYRKRGYEWLYDDPTSRRYDLSGLWLREVRCKRNVMRKLLAPAGMTNFLLFGNDNGSNGNSLAPDDDSSSSSWPASSAINFGKQVFQRLFASSS